MPQSDLFPPGTPDAILETAREFVKRYGRTRTRTSVEFLRTLEAPIHSDGAQQLLQMHWHTHYQSDNVKWRRESWERLNSLAIMLRRPLPAA